MDQSTTVADHEDDSGDQPALEPAARSGTPRRLALAVCLGVVASAVLAWRGSVALFAPTDRNGANSWVLGQLTLTDDAPAKALFSASALVPGAVGSNCLAVSYDGTVHTTVALYASAHTDPRQLLPYVALTIEQGTGGGYGSCTGFSGDTVVYSGTLAEFVGRHVDYASGVGSWSPVGGASSVTYRLSYGLSAATPNDRQASVAKVTFTWEAQG